MDGFSRKRAYGGDIGLISARRCSQDARMLPRAAL